MPAIDLKLLSDFEPQGGRDDWSIDAPVQSRSSWIQFDGIVLIGVSRSRMIIIVRLPNR